MEVLTVKNLSFTYAPLEERALIDINFSVKRGDFVTICGSTGSGKSTLLRMLKKELLPEGKLEGEVLFMGKKLEDLSDLDSAYKIGYVMQRPEQQIVTDKVWHEMAFGLENLGIPNAEIHRKVAEMASYFGIEDWFDKKTDELSGGQKQLLNLASIMVMNPEVLILDEPTAQLDPVAATDFLETVGRLNRDLGITVILVEHRLTEAIPLSTKLLALESGKIISYGDPYEVCNALRNHESLLEAMPSAVRLYNHFPVGESCPLTVREGNEWIKSNFTDNTKDSEHTPYILSEAPALELKDVWFKYGRNYPDVMKGTNLTVFEGEIFCLLGGNGSGKSTTLKNAAGLLRPYHGDIKVFGKRLSEYKNNSLYQGTLSLLPQDVQSVFMCNTVREELKDAMDTVDTLPYDLTPYMDRHPYDLSGGQQQLVALAKVLATNPRLILLDEPTKGIDSHSKIGLMKILRELRDRGMTIVMVTHDVEFAAEISDRCAMYFRGEVTSMDEPWIFFSENNFYTTEINRMTRGYFNGCVTYKDAIKILELNKLQ